MKRMILIASTLFLAVACFPGGGGTSPSGARPAVVGAMYHHWWTPGRWQHSPPNHPYEPILGHYDSSDVNIALQHIRWAKDHGINTFILNFWIRDGEAWVLPNTRILADACEANGMNYFFLLDGWFDFRNAAQPWWEIARRVNAQAAPFFQRPGYLKVSGKPVLFFWAVTPGDLPLMRDVRSGIEGTIGPIYMTGKRNDPVFDRIMEYNPYHPHQNDENGQIAHQDRHWQSLSGTGRAWAPTATPGYNDTQVRQGNPPIALNPDYFRRSLQTALKYPQNDPDGSNWLLLCSWNEFHEGSNIEPSTSFQNPMIFLQVLKQELDRLGPP